MKHRYLLALLFLAVLAAAGCARRRKALDLSGIHTSAAKETMSASTVAATAPEPPSSSKAAQSSPAAFDGASANVSAKVETYKDDSKGSVSIQYPVVSNLTDAALQKKVNELLLANATAIAGSLSAEAPADLDVACEVVAADRSRLTAVYTGTLKVQGESDPANVFYANTVDLKQAKSLGFNDYSDAYTMAGYVMSDDVEFYQADSERVQALLNYRSGMSVEQYAQIFDQADFPLSETKGGAFPESFSYAKEGVLYFSIPAPHALGDYAIVTFNMDGK